MGRYPPPPLPVRRFTARAHGEDPVPLVPDSEEVRRRAREEWRKKYSDRK
jgi:hypothetical protein